MRLRMCLAATALTASCLACRPALIQRSITWFAIDGGSGTVSGLTASGIFSVTGTLGHHDAANSRTGWAFALSHGFRPGADAPCVADFNGVVGVPVDDIFLFLAQLCGSQPDADIDGKGSST